MHPSPSGREGVACGGGPAQEERIPPRGQLVRLTVCAWGRPAAGKGTDTNLCVRRADDLCGHARGAEYPLPPGPAIWGEGKQQRPCTHKPEGITVEDLADHPRHWQDRAGIHIERAAGANS